MRLFETFDPFFRLEGDGRLVATNLGFRLFGLRQDRAGGRGSAIIALPNGEQGSFSVGDELMPGIVLEAVDFDFVTISRNGSNEQIFLDESVWHAAGFGPGDIVISINRKTVSFRARVSG